MRFDELRLAEPLVRAVASEGYDTPTPIQAQAIPVALTGKDLLGCAQTGTGKTCAFALPILHRLAAKPSTSNKPKNRNAAHAARPRALVLSPTRELATQIFESFCTYGRNVPLRHAVVFGGVSQFRQVRQMRSGVDVLVATPGRLLDLIGQGLIDLRAIEVLVLDEADRMLDMGFINDIRKIVKMTPADRQTLFFSATMPAAIRTLADTILNDPAFVKTATVKATDEAITQSVYMVARANKPILLERLLRRREMGRTLIFTRTKHGADKLVKALRRAGIHADAIHGDKSQNARTRALQGFKTGRTPVLVATDVASRGIDVDQITHVVNYDLPNDAETYVHRIGRTARAGASGIALSFCGHEEIRDLRAIERLIGTKIDIQDNEPDLLFDAPVTHKERGPGKPAHRSSTSTPRPIRRRSSPRGSREAAAAGKGGRSRPTNSKNHKQVGKRRRG